MQLKLSPSTLLGVSAALRVILIVFGTFQDAYSDVRYTDIDYDVFTGAAMHVLAGAAPTGTNQQTFRSDSYRTRSDLQVATLMTDLRIGTLLYDM